MAEYLGDYAIGDNVFCDFNTRDFTSHAPATLSGTPSVVIYRDAIATPISAGIFLVVNLNGVVGLNHVDVVASAANGYIPGSTYWFVLAAGTVGGVSMVGEIIGSFSIANRSNIRNITGGSRVIGLDVNGVAYANVINVAGTPQTAGDIYGAEVAILNNMATQTNIANTDIKIAAIQADTDNIQTRIPAALIGGRMDASVGAMAADVVTAAALAADAGAEIRTGLATQVSVSDIQSRLPITLIGGLMDSSVRTIMPNAVNASALATDAVNEIQAGLATTGSVAGLATAAAVAAVQADTDDIQTRMATVGQVTIIGDNVSNIQMRIPGALDAGLMSSIVTVMKPDTLTASALAADAVAEIQNGLAKTSDIADLPTNAELAAALDAIATATEVADAILRRNVAGGSDGVRTVSEALYALRNKTEIIGGFLKVYQTDDSTLAWQGAVTTAPGDPLTSIDPA